MRLKSLSALNRSRPLEIALTTLPGEILMTVYARAKAFAIDELVRSVHGDSFGWYGYTVAEKGKLDLIMDEGLPENDVNKSDYTGISPERIAAYPESLDGDKVVGIYYIVDERETADHRRERASCTYQPAPSVIMTNQIIVGFMVDRFRMILDGRKVSNIFYDSRYPWELKTA